MQPLNDDELNDVLRQWRAPKAPARCEPPWNRINWCWLLTGSLRIPVPVVVLILAACVYFALAIRRPAEKPQPRSVTLADFQPVKQLQPRIIRSEYEGQ